MAYTHIDPGIELQISEHFYSYAGGLDISDLVTLSIAELAKQEQGSAEKEKKIFEKMKSIITEWRGQARETTRLRQAQQYLRSSPAEHTSNCWTEDQYGNHKIRNMVYSMSWRTYEHTRYDRAAQRSVTVSWEVSWWLTYNTPLYPDNSRDGRRLAGQDRKRFTDKADMEKYLQGRINHYAHLFTEISPPIPRGQEGRFSVNGVLLPGYTVEVPEPTPQEVADDLLDFLEDGDMDVPPEPETKEPATEEPPTEGSPADRPLPKPAPRRPKVHKQKKSTPVR